MSTFIGTKMRRKRVLGTSKGTNTQVPFSKPVTNDCNRRSSYPFLKGSPQSPDSPSTFAVPNENMGEPCTLQIQPPNAIEGNLLKNLNNNNMSPDSASLSNGENADINSNSIPVDSSGVISMGDDGTESKKLFTRNSWGEVGQTTRRLSSISALSTNSGSTESLSIDNDQQPEHKSSPEIKPPNSVENNTHNILIQTQQPSLEETDDEKEIEVFPSIPDAFLINLQCASSVEVEDDEYKCEEVEQRYLALSFAFNTDSKSVHQRKGRLQKFRDQAEHNLQMESEKLLKLVHKLNPWCLDVERFELVSNIRNQINIMMEAAKTVSTCSYNLGAVCQEQRLNKAVQLMLKYVETIKMQRDTARRRFKYTSRMLQESTSSTPRKPESPPPKTTNTPPSNNNRLMTRRRASIATIPRPAPVLNDNTTRSAPVRRPTLRSLDLSPVARIETVDRLPFRTSRSSRSELAVGELQKIGENDASDNESDVEVPAPTVELETNPPNDTRLRPSLAICNFFRRYLGDNFHHSGLFYEVCTTLALVCIFMAVTQLGSILLEIEYARQGLPVPWWPSLNELLEFFEGYGIFNIRTDITD